MAAAEPLQTTTGRSPDSPRLTTTESERASIRDVFQAELSVAHVELIRVNSTILYNALATKRHADIDAQDDGSFHSEVLKNAIDLLQRLNRCAPLFPKMDITRKDHNSNFFAKVVFCRTFCCDLEGFDCKHNPRAWIDVFKFFGAMGKIWDRSLFGGRKVSGQARVAAMIHARGDVAPKAKTWTRKGELLWELMGRASEAYKRDNNKSFETWCVEAAVRVGSWRKKVKEDRASLFRLPVEDDWGKHSDDLLPEHDDDAMKLFKEMEIKLRTFYTKCNKQMPEQRTALPAIAKKPPARTTTPDSISQEDGARDPKDPYETNGRSTSEEEMAPEIADPRDNRRKVEVAQRTCPRAWPRIDNTNVLVTQDPRKSIAPPDPGCAELERAKELITEVVRANGGEPDWDPELPRMIIRANFHRY